MRFLADECIPQALIDALRAQGRLVESMREIAPGDSDEKVLGRSLAGELILLSEDNDFGSLVFGGRAEAYGIVLVRLSKFAGRVAAFAPGLARRICEMEDGLAGCLTIIGPDRVRRRALPEVSGSEEPQA